MLPILQPYTHCNVQLVMQVALCAAALKKAGVTVGDSVSGVLCNSSEAVVCMLATTSVGAVWSSCSPDFGVEGVVDRLGQVKPKVKRNALSSFNRCATIDVYL
jgi:acetoacetyl-CoA synthetase